MPKIQRSSEEIDAVREKIMDHALDLIVTEGYDGFSMRKLATRLGIAAKTIYNYFHNQDELYLHLLIKGFDQLLDRFEAAVRTAEDPMDQVGAMIRAYVDFGLDHANIYNLLFTWHVPKYRDYIGTPMEETAHRELTHALKCAEFFMDRMTACLGSDTPVNREELRQEMIQIWSQMHGYVAGINNTLLQYMHPDPVSLKEQIIGRIVANTRREVAALAKRPALKIVPRETGTRKG